MWNVIIYAICVFVFVKTVSYAAWCFKNTGVGGGVAVTVIAILSLLPLIILP